MTTNRELRNYPENSHVFVCKYKHSKNLPHWHSDYELVYVENGCLYANVDFKEYTLTEGSGLLIEAGIIHNFSTEPNTVLSTLFVKEESLNVIKDLRLLSPVLKNSEKLKDAFSVLTQIKTFTPLSLKFCENFAENIIFEIYLNEEYRETAYVGNANNVPPPAF